MILPVPSRPSVNATQLLNAFVVQWSLAWPEGVEPDPQNIRQEVERSQFPEGPWENVGRLPGTLTHFVDITASSQANWYRKTYYRIAVRRLKA